MTAPRPGPSSGQRLASSRAAIESWLAHDGAADPADPAAAGPTPASRVAPQHASPGLLRLLIGALASAWLRRPSQAPVQVGLAMLEASLSPLARRHPWALTATAAGIGMALGLTRPWRWLLRPALLAGLATPLVSQLALRLLQPAPTHSAVADARDAPPSTH